MTSTDPKQQARAKREAIEAEAEALRRRNRNLAILLGLLALGVAVVAAVILLSHKPKPHSAKSPVAGAAETKALLAGIPQHGLALGDPNAPITVLEFMDVQCPYCKAHQLDDQPKVIKDLVRTGQIQLKAQPVALPMMGEDSVAGRAVALRLAHVNRTWDFLNLFYWNQGQETTGYVTPTYLTKLLAAIPGAGKNVSRTIDPADRATAAAIDQAFDAQGKKYEAAGKSFGTPAFAVARTGTPANAFAPIYLDGSGNAAQIEQAVRRVQRSAAS